MAANAHAVARLVAVEGPLKGNSFTLLSGQNSVGRDAQVMPGNQILLAGDDTVSRVHATIQCDNGRCTVYDQGSVNGLFLNGARVLDERDLMSDDLLRMGDTTLRFEKL
jgi:pSer/pThr/pTyr-binding forkhead associated (FHA) protein